MHVGHVYFSIFSKLGNVRRLGGRGSTAVCYYGLCRAGNVVDGGILRSALPLIMAVQTWMGYILSCGTVHKFDYN